jgi:hypothetical protein
MGEDEIRSHLNFQIFGSAILELPSGLYVSLSQGESLSSTFFYRFFVLLRIGRMDVRN